MATTCANAESVWSAISARRGSSKTTSVSAPAVPTMVPMMRPDASARQASRCWWRAVSTCSAAVNGSDMPTPTKTWRWSPFMSSVIATPTTAANSATDGATASHHAVSSSAPVSNCFATIELLTGRTRMPTRIATTAVASATMPKALGTRWCASSSVTPCRRHELNHLRQHLRACTSARGPANVWLFLEQTCGAVPSRPSSRTVARTCCKAGDISVATVRVPARGRIDLMAARAGARCHGRRATRSIRAAQRSRRTTREFDGRVAVNVEAAPPCCTAFVAAKAILRF